MSNLDLDKWYWPEPKKLERANKQAREQLEKTINALLEGYEEQYQKACQAGARTMLDQVKKDAALFIKRDNRSRVYANLMLLLEDEVFVKLNLREAFKASAVIWPDSVPGLIAFLNKIIKELEASQAKS